MGTIYADAIIEGSDLHWKTDVVPLADAMEVIEYLQGVSYRLADPGASQDVQISLIAQEVEECFPEIVHTDEHGYKSVSYARLVAPLIEGMKAQQVGIDVLEDKVLGLEARNAQLEARLSRLDALLRGDR